MYLIIDSFLLLILVAISQESSAENCYSDIACSGDVVHEDAISPLECCSRFGYSYISTTSSVCQTCLRTLYSRYSANYCVC